MQLFGLNGMCETGCLCAPDPGTTDEWMDGSWRGDGRTPQFLSAPDGHPHGAAQNKATKPLQRLGMH